MILFINSLKKNITLSIIKDTNKLQEFNIPSGDDFSSFPEAIIQILSDNPGIREIWNINGPGSFTRTRIVTLTLNTIHYTKHIPVKGCHLFDLIEENPILQINNQEFLIKNGVGEIERVEYEKLKPGKYIGYLIKNDFTEEKVFIEYKEDWKKIEKLFSFIQETNILNPIYLKAPHITCSKKNTFPC